MASTGPAHTLLDMPNEVLGEIFAHLNRDDRRALLHTCHALHANTACLSKINQATLFLDTNQHGCMHRQLSTIIPGSAVSKLVIRGTLSIAHKKHLFVEGVAEEDQSGVAPVTPIFLAAFPLHRQLLSQITCLELDEYCIITDAADLVTCLKEHLPRLKHLSMRGGVGENGETECVLSELQRLHLQSLCFVAWHLCYGEFFTAAPLSPSACEVLGRLHSLEHLKVRCQGVISFLPLSGLTNLKTLTLDGCFRIGGDTGLNAFLAACPNLTELRLPRVEDMPRSSSVRRMSIESCCMVGLPTRATLPTLTHLSVHCIEHDLWHSEVQLDGTLQALSGVQVKCGCASISSSENSLRSCAGFLHLLSSRAFVFGAVKLLCSDILFPPGLLASLASHFPEVQKLSLEECSFSLPELCMFPKLTTCSMHPLREDLKDGVGFGCFRRGILEVCFAIQAQRPATLPKLRLKVNDWDHVQPDGLLELKECLEGLAESGEVSRVCLACSFHEDGDDMDWLLL